MGYMASSRCNVCAGCGLIKIQDLHAEALYEWVEGYFDEDTDNEWLEKQLKTLIKKRKDKFK